MLQYNTSPEKKYSFFCSLIRAVPSSPAQKRAPIGPFSPEIGTSPPLPPKHLLQWGGGCSGRHAPSGKIPPCHTEAGAPPGRGGTIPHTLAVPARRSGAPAPDRASPSPPVRPLAGPPSGGPHRSCQYPPVDPRYPQALPVRCSEAAASLPAPAPDYYGEILRPVPFRQEINRRRQLIMPGQPYPCSRRGTVVKQHIRTGHGLLRSPRNEPASSLGRPPARPL